MSNTGCSIIDMARMIEAYVQFANISTVGVLHLFYSVAVQAVHTFLTDQLCGCMQAWLQLHVAHLPHLCLQGGKLFLVGNTRKLSVSDLSPLQDFLAPQQCYEHLIAELIPA